MSEWSRPFRITGQHAKPLLPGMDDLPDQSRRHAIYLAFTALAAAFLPRGTAALAADTLPLNAPLPANVPPNTTLVIGDPVTQAALELSGDIKNLPFKVQWANISGGPQTIEAFRGRALDVGSVADIPPIFATWTGLSVKIVAAQFRQDPIHHPIYELGISPKAKVDSLADLKGKKIAYSPGQAQGALVLRVLQKAGLTKNDVQLIELPSTGDVYPNALASGLVDVAPIGGVSIKRYLDQYSRDGARTIPHGLRDDPEYLYVLTSVLQDPGKAAALREYIKHWALAIRWINTHPKEWIDGYYVKSQGLSSADGQYLVNQAGTPDVPANWDDVIKRQQETIDLLAREEGRPRLNAADLFDRRYETVAADALDHE